MRMTGSLLTLAALGLAGCVTSAEHEAAKLARHHAEDDHLCRLAGFRPGTDPYRFCRNERAHERGISRQADRIKQSL